MRTKKSPLLALLNSKRLEISPKNGGRARVAGEPMTSLPNWGWVQDSNLRHPFRALRFSRPVHSTALPTHHSGL